MIIVSSSEIAKLLADADVSRYLGAVGLVALIYDYLLTLPEEVSLIWRAPPSGPKYAFLLNRYIVPTILIAMAYANCGFSAIPLDDNGCRLLSIIAAVFAIFSIGVANVLVLLRVVLLWDNNQTARRLMTGGFLISFCTTCGFTVATLWQLESSFRYNWLARMCITETSTHALIGVWASPIAFELLVLIATCWNALDRPMQNNVPLIKALRRDGITFFLALTMLRATNLSLAVTSRPELIFILVFFVWASTTLVLNRSVLSLQRAEVLNSLRIAISNTPRASSPFGIRLEQLDDYEPETDIYDELELWKSKGFATNGSSGWV